MVMDGVKRYRIIIFTLSRLSLVWACFGIEDRWPLCVLSLGCSW